MSLQLWIIATVLAVDVGGALAGVVLSVVYKLKYTADDGENGGPCCTSKAPAPLLQPGRRAQVEHEADEAE